MVLKPTDANGLELNLYGDLESPKIRLLRNGVGMPGGELRYGVAGVERLAVSPDVNVDGIVDHIPVDVVAVPNPDQEVG